MIYIKEKDLPKTVTRKGLIKHFINVRPNTYYNEQCTELQCESGRFRSITELHEIVCSRFPKTSFNAILRIIKELVEENESVTMVWCTQVKKVVLKYIDKATKKYMSKYSKDEYYTSVGKDGYSLKDYEEIIENIKNQ